MKQKKITTDGYPQYIVKKEMYNKYRQEKNTETDNISKIKTPGLNDKDALANENTTKPNMFNEDKSGNDLDAPLAGLENEEENIGSEDEENNYYSLGADANGYLEEDRD